MEEVKVEEVEIKEEVKEEVKKPYEFKELSFDNIFPMMNLINKIGIEKLSSLMNNKAIMNLIQGIKPMKIDEEGNEVVDSDEEMKQLASAMISIVHLIVSSLGTCREELYEVLSSGSNLSYEEVSKLPLKYVSSMIIDFIKKDDFKDFFTELLGSLGMN